jgi:hypothetical protein
MKKELKKYLIFSSLCLVFACIYEMFSHQVYSMFMIFSFLIPLIMGVGVYALLVKKHFLVNNISNSLYKMSLYTFTFGSIMKGVLDIYGTTNSKLVIYWIVGGIMLVAAIVWQIINRRKSIK